jgi:hypothetical protein
MLSHHNPPQKNIIIFYGIEIIGVVLAKILKRER